MPTCCKLTSLIYVPSLSYMTKLYNCTTSASAIVWTILMAANSLGLRANPSPWDVFQTLLVEALP